MAFKGHTNVAGADSASVIRDAQIGNAAVADFHGDACCTCVQAVFHQLLDRRGGAFNDFACGNLANQLLIELEYRSVFHGSLPFFFITLI